MNQIHQANLLVAAAATLFALAEHCSKMRASSESFYKWSGDNNPPIKRFPTWAATLAVFCMAVAIVITAMQPAQLHLPKPDKIDLTRSARCIAATSRILIAMPSDSRDRQRLALTDLRERHITRAELVASQEQLDKAIDAQFHTLERAANNGGPWDWQKECELDQ
ncbi:MAG: hypothetical protein ACR2PG_01785 [Hyphomicrobiaceae bacterium]